MDSHVVVGFLLCHTRMMDSTVLCEIFEAFDIFLNLNHAWNDQKYDKYGVKTRDVWHYLLILTKKKVTSENISDVYWQDHIHHKTWGRYSNILAHKYFPTSKFYTMHTLHIKLFGLFSHSKCKRDRFKVEFFEIFLFIWQNSQHNQWVLHFLASLGCLEWFAEGSKSKCKDRNVSF